MLAPSPLPIRKSAASGVRQSSKCLLFIYSLLAEFHTTSNKMPLMFGKSIGILFLASQVALAQTAHPSAKRSVAPKPECPLIYNELDHDLTQPCYVLDGFITTKIDISVAPGTKLIFRENTSIHVEENTSFSAVGTAERPILMEGKEHAPGFWSGIEFSSVSNKNRLSYVHLSDAGASNGSSSGAVRLTRKGTAGIDHSIISNSKTNGLYVGDYTRLLDFTANRLEGNNALMDIPVGTLGKIDGATQFVGNKKQRIDVTRGDAEEDAEWPGFAVPVYISGYTKIEANITIHSGAQFLFAQDTGFFVESNGSLQAQGSQEHPIVFTSEAGMPGAWHGIAIGTRNSKNILDHVRVEWAGSGSGGAIHVGYPSPGALKLTNSVISGSQTAGVLIEKDRATTIPSPAELTAQNQFLNNIGQPVEVR